MRCTGIARDPRLAARVRVVGAVAASQMAAYYSAADIFVSASHREGSGYAAIEAMACGAVPVLTDIPSFRVLTANGRVGALWQQGQPRVSATPSSKWRRSPASSSAHVCSNSSVPPSRGKCWVAAPWESIARYVTAEALRDTSR